MARCSCSSVWVAASRAIVSLCSSHSSASTVLFPKRFAIPTASCQKDSEWVDVPGEQGCERFTWGLLLVARACATGQYSECYWILTEPLDSAPWLFAGFRQLHTSLAGSTVYHRMPHIPGFSSTQCGWHIRRLAAGTKLVHIISTFFGL